MAKHKALKSSAGEDFMLWFLNPHVKKVTLPYNLESKKVIDQLKMIGSVSRYFFNGQFFSYFVFVFIYYLVKFSER